jgi:hypothetical protein
LGCSRARALTPRAKREGSNIWLWIWFWYGIENRAQKRCVRFFQNGVLFSGLNGLLAVAMSGASGPHRGYPQRRAEATFVRLLSRFLLAGSRFMSKSYQDAGHAQMHPRQGTE